MVCGISLDNRGFGGLQSAIRVTDVALSQHQIIMCA